MTIWPDPWTFPRRMTAGVQGPSNLQMDRLIHRAKTARLLRRFFGTPIRDPFPATERRHDEHDEDEATGRAGSWD